MQEIWSFLSKLSQKGGDIDLTTIRGNLQCEVCGAKTLIRIQLGWLDMHPIRFNCGKCGILISGTLFQDPIQGRAHTEFDNVKEVSNSKSDYYIEASGELLTEKLQPYKFEKTLFPPFFTSGFWMMKEDIEKFKEKTIKFLTIVKMDWPKYRRVNELWLNGNYQFLSKELKKHIPNKQFPLKNELHYLIAVRQMNIGLLANVLNNDFFHKHFKFLREEVVKLLDESPKELEKLVEHFSIFLHRYEEKIFECIKQFTEKFRFMIPVFGMDFYKDNSYIEDDTKGITTVSFEELKQFYVDIYEVIAEMLDLVVGYNNLKYRGSVQVMKNKRRDIITLDEYTNKSKGAKIEFLDGNEVFDNLVFPHLNNKLRNAIGHNTYKVDGINQLITYYPSGDENIENPPTISLKDFTKDCWDIFQSLINITELVYQTRKLVYLKQNLVPSSEHIFEEKPAISKKKKQNNKLKLEKQKKKSRKNNRSKK